MTVNKVFSAAGVSDSLHVRSKEKLQYTVSVGGGFAEVLYLERSSNGGLNWEAVVSGITGAVSATTLLNDTAKAQLYRFRCEQIGGAFTGDADITLDQVTEDVAGGEFKNNAGKTVGSVTEDGIRVDKVTVPASGLVIGTTPVTATAAQLNGAAGISNGAILNASQAWDPGSIGPGSEETLDVTVTGAALGDFAIASFSLDLEGLVLDANVKAANTVTLVLANHTGAPVDLAAGTAYIRVLRR